MANEVDDWFATSEHPKKDLMQAVRRVILDADPRVSESIKWKTPTFEFKGNIASFNPQAKQFVSLMFHTGASIPGEYPSLSGSGNVARYMQFADETDLAAKTAELQSIIAAWCALKEK
jgi:hypothetical protein